MSKLKDIARQLDLSQSTVSLVLNDKADRYRISQDTQNKIRALASSMGYVRNANAASLRSGKSHLAGLILPDFLHWGFSRLSRELEDVFATKGLQLIIASSRDDPYTEESLIKSMLSRRVDVLLSISSLTDYRLYQHALDKGIPVILLDRCAQPRIFPSIVGNDFEIIHQLLDSLKNNKAHNIAYLGGKPGLSTTNIRNQAIQSWERQHQQKIICLHKGYLLDDGVNLAQQLFSQHANIDGILCGSFTILEGLLRHMDDAGLDTNAFHFATIGNHKLLDLLRIRTLSARQDYKKMAQTAFAIFQEYDKWKGQQIILQRTLQKR